MKKLKLDVEHLRVESFETERRDGRRGTVIAAEYGEPATIVQPPESGNIYCLTVQPCIPTNEDTGGCNTCQASCADCTGTDGHGWGDLY